MTEKKNNIIRNLTGILFLMVLSFLVPVVCYTYTKEADWHALTLADFLLKQWKRGNILPVYDLSVLNGTDPFSINSWLTTAVLTVLKQAGISDSIAFSLVVTLGSLLGATGFFYSGMKQDRRAYGAFAGAVWILSDTIMIMGTHDLSGYLALCLFPWMLYYLHENRQNHKGLTGLLIAWLLMGELSPAVSLMILLPLIVDIMLFCCFNRQWKDGLRLLGFLAIIFMADAYRMIPFLQHSSFSKTAVSFGNGLNPFGNGTYYGTGVLLSALIGLAGGDRHTVPDFLSALLVFFLSGTGLRVPVKNVTEIACGISLAFVLQAFPEWKSARKEASMAICLLLCLDLILPREQMIYHVLRGDQVQTTAVSDQMVKKAGRITTQRLLVLEGDQQDAYLHWTLRNTNVSGGDQLDQSGMKDKISLLETAVNDGQYGYLFTRAKILGDDTVLIAKSQIHEYRIRENESKTIIQKAEENGYVPEGENRKWILFHADQKGTWGTVTGWNAIAIGKDASTIALSFEDTRETEDPDLNHYTFRELSAYRTVYLSGFTYEDQKKAEDLVLKLSQAGVRVVILADGIPYSRENRMKEFMGVSCNAISFENGYPELETSEMGTFDPDLFPHGCHNWHTYYLNGLDSVKGKIRDEDVSLAFWGTRDNQNLVFIGLNLPYYYQLTGDDSAGRILSSVLDTKSGQLPDIRTVSLKITGKNHEIDIRSDEDHVCSSLLMLDSYHTDRKTEDLNGFVTVHKGTTEIRIYRQNEILYLTVSLGFLALAVWLIWKNHKIIR